MIEEDAVAEPIKAPAQPAEGGTEERIHVQAGAEADRAEADEAVVGRVHGEAGIGSDGRAIDIPRVIDRHVDLVRAGRSHFDIALVLGHVFLRRVLQVAGGLGALAQRLHGGRTSCGWL